MLRIESAKPLTHWLAACVLSVVSLVQLSAAQAQTPPQILVLTTHEGNLADFAKLTAEAQGGVRVAQNAAKAFGYIPQNDSSKDFDTASVPATVSPTPNVKFSYGTLTVRKRLTNDIAVSGDAAPKSKLVRVLTSTLNASGATISETVQSMPDNSETLDFDPALPIEVAALKKLFLTSNGQRYDIIIVGSAYKKIVDQAYNTLASVMQDPLLKPASILYFVDSCCDTGYANSTNTARLKDKILIPGSGDLSLSIKKNNLGVLDATLNTSSVEYSKSFGANPSVLPAPYPAAPKNGWLPKIAGGYVNTMFFSTTGHGTDNILFKATDVTAPIYALFYPTVQSFNNNGTCTFAVLDISPFNTGAAFYTRNTDYHATKNPTGRNIGQAFLNASLAGGSCGGNASIAIAPDTQDVTLAAPQPAKPIVLTITNETLDRASNVDGSIDGGRVQASLPTHMQLVAGANSVSTTCKDASGNPVTPAVPSPVVGSSMDSFSVTGVKLAYQASCTITLNVQWSDPNANVVASPGNPINSCINATVNPATNAPANRSTLSIATGTTQQFSTNQGQLAALVSSSIVCTAPELALSIPTLPNASYSVGDTVSYDVTVQSLSQTAAANGIVFSGLAPAGVAPANITVVPKAGQTNPVACASASNCSLTTSNQVGSSATFTVSFPAPVTAGSASMTWTPTVALTPGNQEVTLTNNAQSLGANLNTYPLNVNAQLTSSGTITNYASQYAGTAQAVSVNGCTIASQSGAVQLGAAQNTTGTAFQLQILANSGTCAVSFPNSASSPDPLLLPPGFVMQPVVVSGPAPDANNVPTVTGTWTALPPAAGSVLGSVTGAPTPFPANLVGQTVGYSLTCAPNVALPATGTLTVGANGALTAAAQPQIPSGSSCTIALTSDPSTLPLPKFYKWDTPVLSTATTSPFTVTLKMAPMPTQLSVQAQLNVPGSGDFSTLSGNPIAFTVANCSAATTSGSAPLGIGKPGAAQILSTKAGEECEVSFTGSPNTDALPPGYILQAAMANAKAAKTSAATKAAAAPTLVLTSTMDPVTGNQTVIATWTVLPPGAASVTGSVTGAPSTFPSNLVGQTVSFALTCTPGAATPANGTLTIDASGQLTTSVQPQVPSGSTCSLALSSDPGALPLPSGYQWGAPVIAGSGNSFTVTLPMSPKGVVSATPVPTLAQWALYLLGMLMLVAAARQLRTRR